MEGFVDRPKYACALGGAIAVLNALPRVVPILHAAPGCGLNLSYAINGGSGYMGSGYCGGAALPSSNVCEQEIVFGGEDRLLEEIEKTILLVDGDLYVVLSACMVDMIGDDVVSTVRRANIGDARVLAAETGGFKGNSYMGYDIVLSTLFREFVELQSEKDSYVVNLFGLVPAHDVFLKGNLANLKSLLAKLGLRVNTFFSEDETLDDLKNCGNAALNIVLSDTYGISSAAVFEEVHGTPYITTGLPIGAHATEVFLNQVAAALEIDAALVNTVNGSERKRYFKLLAQLSDLYNDYDLQRYAVIVADANYAPALAKFVADDLGFLPEVAIINDILPEDEKETVTARFRGSKSGLTPAIIYEVKEAEILPHIKRHWELDHGNKYYNAMTPAVIIGSSFEIDLASDLGLPLLSVSYPITNRVVLTRGYAGYAGGLSLAEDLLSVLITAR